MSLLSLFLVLFFLLGCDDPLDPHDSIVSASQTGEVPGEPQETAPADPGQQSIAPFHPFAPTQQAGPPSASFQKVPNQYVSCTRGVDFVGVSLYFHEPDKEGMTCSFWFVSRIHVKDGLYSEAVSREKWSNDESCVAPAQEKINFKQDTGWTCKEQKIILKSNVSSGEQAKKPAASGGAI